MESPLSRIRSIVVHAFIVCGGIALACVAAEVALRVYMAATGRSGASLEQDLQKAASAELDGSFRGSTLGALVRPSRFDEIVYELKPNLRGTFLEKPLETNSFGFRGREVDREKALGTTRIVGIGDSVMFGWGVSDADSYLRVVESRLRADGRQVEALNFAVPGYNTSMEVAMLEHRALSFSPDLVVLHFVNNDFGVPHFMVRPNNMFSMRESYLLRLVEVLRGKKKSSSRNGDGLMQLAVGGGDKTRDSEVLQQYQYMLGREGFLRAAEKLHALTTARQIPVFVLVGGAPRAMYKALKNACKKYRFTLVEAKPYVDRYFASRGRAFSMKKRARALQLKSGDPHPNETGHGLYAQALYDAIVAPREQARKE